MVGLLIWRFRLAAPRDKGFLNIVKKAHYLEPVFYLISALFILFYIWIIIDAYQVAKRAGTADKRKSIVVFVLLILVFFIIGWQIGQIDLYALFTQFDDALPAISRVLWPWERAITYPPESRKAGTDNRRDTGKVSSQPSGRHRQTREGRQHQTSESHTEGLRSGSVRHGCRLRSLPILAV